MLHSLKKSEIPELGFAEFIALTALMMSLVALSVDAMLPALSEIGRDPGVMDNNSSQLIISLVFSEWLPVHCSTARCCWFALNLHLTHCRNRHRSELQRNRLASHGRFFHAQFGIALVNAMGGKIKRYALRAIIRPLPTVPAAEASRQRVMPRTTSLYIS